MSMIRAQEYFAPLRSRHISLQQWERGLLFESWSSRGGRAEREKSGDLNTCMAAPELEEQEFRPVKKVMARSVSFSASIGKETSSELKTKNFARGLSFPRSLASHGEIIPEESDYCTARRSNADLSPMFAGQTSTAYLFPRSLERVESGHIELSETSESSCPSSEDSSDFSDRPADPETRPWPRRFFSGGLSLSRDKKFFSGVLSFSKDKKFFSGSLSFPRPCGKSLDRSRSWEVNDISSLGHDIKSGTSSSPESCFKNRFLGRVLTFSRSLDSRGETQSNRRAEIRRGLSFSRSLDPAGEVSLDSGGETPCNRRADIRRGLSFSRSLDPTGEGSLDSEGETPSNRRTEIRRGLSFSRSLDPRGEVSNRRTEIRRGLSFSRSLDVNGELLSSENCSDSGSFASGRLPEISWSRRFISRSGLFFSRTLSPKRSPGSFASTPLGTPVKSSEKESEKDSDTEVRPKRPFGRGFSLSFSRFLDPSNYASSVNAGGTNGRGNVEKESNLKRFFTRVFQNSKSVDPVTEQPTVAAAHDTAGSSGNSSKTSLPKRFFSKDWSWSRNKSRSTSPTQNSSQNLTNRGNSSAGDDVSGEADSSQLPSSRHSQALKTWWSKRWQSSVSNSKSTLSPENSRLVLLEKVPPANDQESDDLTVYVGERGGSLTKYVLARKILRHHLFQVLLKCSQDELGSDHDYNSGVPIICDPALFLQVARVVGGNFASQTELCR